MSVQAVHLHFDVYTSVGYMLRIDCWEAEKNLKTTPGSECALTSLAIDANNLVGSLSTQCCFIQSIIGFRLCQLHQMPHTPADHISVSL